MNLYLSNGYLDMSKIIDDPNPFVFVIGGRGIGKTYGALSYLLNKDKRFLLMRRTQAQTDLISKPDFSPFKSINEDLDINIVTAPVNKYSAGYYVGVEKDGKIVPQGAPIGYTCALSTISNLRGFDSSDIDIIIYDEFIPESHERTMRAEGQALLNAYETVNRNRELNGKEPVKLVALSNSNDIANPIFIELNIIPIVDRMMKKGQEYYSNPSRGLTIINVLHSPISDRKQETALYKLASDDSEFSEMALHNNYNTDRGSRIKSIKLTDYNPVVKVGDITFYKHKSDSKYYCSMHKSGTCPEFGANDTDFKRFKNRYLFLWWAYISNKIDFESILCETLYNTYYKTFK